MPKGVRLLKREESCNLDEAMKTSKDVHDLHLMLKWFAEASVSKLPSSNGLERKEIETNENCFVHAVLYRLNKDISYAELRSNVCKHLIKKEHHYMYISYISTDDGSDSDMHETYRTMVAKLERSGVWNVLYVKSSPYCYCRFAEH